ncbi:MAG TPA: flavodoxin family protein [Clostridia bacterium]|nr:flavodoxin family protein [Clostridia bacterium]
MRICILFGSLRENSNTGLLLQPFIEELKRLGAEIDFISLKDKHIEPCTACWTCQNIFEEPGCPKKDDMNILYEAVLKSDCIIFASPIYSWYCTPPMKAVMDRLVYGMNKYYGDTEGPCLWEGKKCALVTTCGYEIEDGAGVFEEGMRRYSKHSNLQYLGKLAVQDIDGKSYFQNESAVNAAKEFAVKVYDSLV